MIKGIIGNGAFAREIYWSLEYNDRINCIFFVDDKIYDEKEKNTLPISKFDLEKYEVIIAIANAKIRERIVSELPKETKFFTHINKSVIIQGDDVEIGDGSIICAGSILTTNIKIGKHTHLNLQTTIGHDNMIGDYFTTAPSVSISGNCIIGDRVYFGTKSCTKEKIKICDDVIVGLHAGVLKSIDMPGIYVGTPAKLINK
jgi:sugar O-acyltransferase (sialic acid O-acetyltransferase NeuD family)